MKKLNRIIRQALYDIVTILEEDDDLARERTLSYLIDMIPDYWEMPGDAA